MIRLLIVFLLLGNVALAKCPDYTAAYVGNDKIEGFNRKVFEFNLKLNKYALKPVHILWASVMPQYGIDRIQSVYDNIEYPKRLVSTLIQRDFKASGTETVRFLTNTTLGLGGMFDPAQRFLHIKPVDEDMDQALSSLHIKSGGHVVVPALAPTTPRGLAGKVLDAALNPTTYVATPILAIIKAGFTINRTSSVQQMVKLLESNCADPYDIAKKFTHVHSHIKCANLDRHEVLETAINKIEQPDMNLVDVNNDADDGKLLSATDMAKDGDNIVRNYDLNSSKLLADVILFDYNPQTPVVDAMRTALLDRDDLNSKFWNELSVWNRSFSKRIKTSSVLISPDRAKYSYRFILQKDKSAPLAIIYPSVGEGINSYHSVIFAKMFYDEGYSVLIQGSHFHYDFVKSMQRGYYPGNPYDDADYLKMVTSKIIADLQRKYKIAPSEKMFFGTSLGAMNVLFLAEKESVNNTFGKAKFIAVCPPVELKYAISQIDKNMSDWSEENFKDKTSVTAAKILHLYKTKDKSGITYLPFSDSEGKLITSFIMHQKLSDLIFTLENTSRCKCCCDFYNNDISYSDYAKKYLNDDFEKADLHYISDYLKNGKNYKIYHSLDDYLTNSQQLKQLKSYCGKNAVYMSNGSHLGFLYRKEFLEALTNDIKLVQ